MVANIEFHFLDTDFTEKLPNVRVIRVQRGSAVSLESLYGTVSTGISCFRENLQWQHTAEIYR